MRYASREGVEFARAWRGEVGEGRPLLLEEELGDGRVET
jgi:hypothetical protein